MLELPIPAYNMNINNYKAYKKIRRSWGNTKPATKIKESNKIYNRNKNKKEIHETIKNELHF